MIPRAEILELVKGVTKKAARWDGDAEEQLGIWKSQESGYIELSISAYRSIGVDEYRQAFDAKTNQLSSTMSGVRVFTLTCKCRSFEMGEAPFDILEDLRLGLRTNSARFILTGAGLALVDVPSLTVLPPEEIDNRTAQVAVMDVRLAIAVNSDRAGDDAGGIIQTVNSGGKIPGTVTN